MATWDSVQEQRKHFWPWEPGQALWVDAIEPVATNLGRIIRYVQGGQ